MFTPGSSAASLAPGVKADVVTNTPAARLIALALAATFVPAGPRAGRGERNDVLGDKRMPHASVDKAEVGVYYASLNMCSIL